MSLRQPRRSKMTRTRVVAGLLAALWLLVVLPVFAGNRYEESFFILHEDHHIFGDEEVGRDANVDETAGLVALCKPDMIQMHAKGNPGWTTYPTKIGFAPSRLRGDVLGVWRDVARRGNYGFGVYFNLGNDGRIAATQPQWIRTDPRRQTTGSGNVFPFRCGCEIPVAHDPRDHGDLSSGQLLV